jgi:hypothetical protein
MVSAHSRLAAASARSFHGNNYRNHSGQRIDQVSPFIVDPDRVKQAEEMRAMRLAAREKKELKAKTVRRRSRPSLSSRAPGVLSHPSALAIGVL